MSEKTFARAAAMALLALSTTLVFGQQPATLTIHADQPDYGVSPMLYGLMTEEINYSYDGGLYAEMVRNRTFGSDWSGILYWYVIEDGNASAKMVADKDSGPSEALKTSLRLEVEQADTKNQAGVMNVGWWGMALSPDTNYKGSFYAKASLEDLGPVTVSLVNDRTGKAVATAIVPRVSTGWQRYEFTLKTGAIQASSANHLAITVGHGGTLWLQLVSLFPPTYHDRPNGFRIDLMEKLAAMHPKFLRFPGGNYLEGDHIADRFEWKKTIGPLVDRPTHPSPWGYRSSDGMGLLEFLEWCEDLDMKPVLAVYAGYSLHGEHVNPGPDLEPYVQDALDEIEYVTGGPDTEWGAARVRDGHPAPFKLAYVEIGNEEWFDRSGSYDDRFAQFSKAIKTRYPDLELIATAPITSVKPDVIDQHFYVRATTNFRDATHFDKTEGSPALHWDNGHYEKADRNGPKIFVGEWATREGFPTPDFGAALGDAAWMTGLERNSDIVVMASYAPLLVNVDPGGMQWETDLIGYNAARSYGSPAYYAQVMFASNLGDQVLKSELASAGPKFFYSITDDRAKKKLYLKLVNAASDVQPIQINFDGTRVASTAKLLTLKAHDMRETNSINDPARIMPVESAVHGVTSNWRTTIPSYSIQVMVLDEQ